jgi:hypothetical protein
MKIKNHIWLVFLALIITQCKKGPEFDSLIPYQEKQNSYWGYIDLKGNKKIEPNFKNLPGLFYNGYAQIKTTDGSVDFIDKNGREYERNYMDATDFHEGLAFAVKEGEYPTLLNLKLEEVKILEKVDIVNVPGEGLVCFKNTQGRWGFLSKDGQVAIQPVYAFANNFSEGLAMVKIIEYDTSKGNTTEKTLCGFVDKKGVEVIKPTEKFKNLRSFSDGLAAYSDGDDWGWGFIDKNGKKVIRAKQEWDEVTDFHGGVASVKIDGLWGLINKKGKVIIHPKFEAPLIFERGLTTGEKDDKIGFINRKGEWAIDPAFEDIAMDFSIGKAIVKKDNYYIFINRNGNQRTSREFDNVKYSHLFTGSVRSDFFDTEVVIDTLISQISTVSLNSISAQTTLEEIMKKYRLNDSDLPKNSYQTSLKVQDIDIDGEILSTVTLDFDKNISLKITRRIREYWFTYEQVIGYRPNNSALVTSVKFDVRLDGRKEGKGEILAKEFKKVFEQNGFILDKERSSSEEFVLRTTEGGPSASVEFEKNSVNASVKF